MPKPTTVLGINAYHGDSSACLVVDGRLVAAVEEERFLRVKHWAGFPTRAILYCLEAGGISIEELDHIAINRKPGGNKLRKALFALSNRPSAKLVKDRLMNHKKVEQLDEAFAEALCVDRSDLRAEVHNVEHHLSHLASSFFVSPYDSAAVVSMDGFGDFASCAWGHGQGNKIEQSGRIYFPHSMGLYYLAMTQYLGFPNYGDEYKVMGLAPYGEPTEIEKMRQIVSLEPGGHFSLELDYFVHHKGGVEMVWEDGEPRLGAAWSEKLTELLGPAREPGSEITLHHKNLAASVQAMYEEALFHVLEEVWRETRNPRLCLSGGCAMNSVANGKIRDNTSFQDVYIQPAAGDAGGAIGAAFAVWNQDLQNPRSFTMDHAYWGPGCNEDEITRELMAATEELEAKDRRVERIESGDELCAKVAAAIAEGKVIGWFQGRMEWGPRALGNRSIIADPRRTDVRDILNLKIKRRESFRPFAPSVLREHAAEWFDCDWEVPFMMQVRPVREDKRDQVPAITHVDGSGRLQTVDATQNPLYHKLITAFHALTGVPLLVNTSFNENEPVVCRPKEALDCFLRTDMDLLVLGNYCVINRSSPSPDGVTPTDCSARSVS